MKRLFLLAFFLCVASVSVAQPPRAKFSITGRTLNYGNVTVNKTKDMTVTFRVDSSATAPVHVSMDYPASSEYSIVNNDTGFTIAIAASHTVTIHFAPTSVGTFNDSLLVHHDGDTTSAKNPTKIRMFGAGIASDTFPKITVPQKNIFFGNVNLGVKKQLNFIVTNSTDTIRTLTGSIGSPIKGEPFSVATAGGLFTLNQNDTIRVFVNFQPTNAGTFVDTLLITSNAKAPDNVIKVILSGIGIGPDTLPKIAVTPKFLFYNSVRTDSTVVRTFTIVNSGTDTTHKLIGVVAGTHTQSFTITKGEGAYSLKKGDTLKVEVTCTPTTTGQITDTVTVTSNTDVTTQKINVLLVVSGVAAPGSDTIAKVTFGKRTLTFDTLTVGDPSQALFLVITNSSTADLPLNLLFTNPAFPFVFSGGAPLTLSKGEQHIDTIRFQAATAGTYNDSIVVSSNTSDQTKRTVIRLSGVVKDKPASVREVDKLIESVSLFPNPVSHSTTLALNLTKDEYVGVSIVDITGREVKTLSPKNISNAYTFDLDCTELSNGVYFIKLDLVAGSKLVRFVVSK